MSPTQTVLDKRGYCFLFPALGLPDPEGEWVSLTAAIGSPDKVNPAIQDPNVVAPMRFPTGEEEIAEIEQSGAIWLVPCLKSKEEDPLKDPEFFTIRVRRIPAASALPNPKRVQIAGGRRPLFIQPRPTQLYFESIGISTRPDDSPLSRDGGVNIGTEQEDFSQSISWSGRHGETITFFAFTPWLQQVTTNLIIECLRAGTVKPCEGVRTTIKLRAHPAKNDDFRTLDYIARLAEDKSPVREQDWKPLPAEATKPGVQRWCVNLARKSVNKQPISREEWGASN